MTVEDNLRLGGYSRYRRGARDGATLLAQTFVWFPRLHERRLQRAGTLSGGERQMLAIGRALMNKPRLLLLDEPSLGLAPLIIREIFGIIAELRAAGVSILLVEQHARAALQLSDDGLGPVEHQPLAALGPPGHPSLVHGSDAFRRRQTVCPYPERRPGHVGGISRQSAVAPLNGGALFANC